MNVLLLTSHAIAERDDLDMFTRMGVPTYSIGGAYDSIPFEGRRPAIANVQRYPDLEDATNRQRAKLTDLLGSPDRRPHGGRFYVDWAKADLAPEVADWADTVIIHHFPEEWLELNWPKLAGKRVIWRTCGQSDPRLEMAMAAYVDRGLQVVRYSPKEAEAFPKWGHFAGQDALIRFGKDPNEWHGWTGEDPVVGNITQDMFHRGDACGLSFWEAATEGLPTRPAGPGSEALRGGIGSLSYDDMRAYLRRIRVYLYTGTRPASYTLGLIEAMMTGVPVITMSADYFRPYELWEGSDIADGSMKSGSPEYINRLIRTWYLGDDGKQPVEGIPSEDSEWGRARAIELFGIDGVMAQWHDFLGTGS